MRAYASASVACVCVCVCLCTHLETSPPHHRKAPLRARARLSVPAEILSRGVEAKFLPVGQVRAGWIWSGHCQVAPLSGVQVHENLRLDRLCEGGDIRPRNPQPHAIRGWTVFRVTQVLSAACLALEDFETSLGDGWPLSSKK